MQQIIPIRQFVAVLGLVSVGFFVVAFVVCSILTPEFDPLSDYISKLGAEGQPLAIWWNSIGFVVVGMFLEAFGFAFGSTIHDLTTGICLALSGIAFALAAIPTDLINPDASLSKAHFVSICLSLAGWCFALARISCLPSLERIIRRQAAIASTLVVIPMIGASVGLLSMPITHRLILIVVFGWVFSTSLAFSSKKPTSADVA